jgi:hypothetical protein
MRREAAKLQVALIIPLLRVKGAPEGKAAAERARMLIEQAEGLGETPEDPLLLFSALYSFWVASLLSVNVDIVYQLAAEFLALAKERSALEQIPVDFTHSLHA